VNERRLKVALVVLGAAIAWTIPFVLVRSGDYFAFLLPWYNHIVAAGPLGAFGQPFGNYTPPYYYLLSAVSQLGLPPLVAIKGLSILGALWLAFAISRLTAKPEAGAWSLLLPTVVFNVPFMGQADVFWLAPCVLAVAAAVRREPVRSALWASVGFAFKAQAIFLAPFVALVLIRRRAPLWSWLIPVAVYLAAILPAALAGWPLTDLLTVYLRQAAWHLPGEVFISGAPNLWMLVRLAAPHLYSVALGIILAEMAAVAYVWRLLRADMNAHGLLTAAALSAAMLPFLLPGMHERFFALFEVLTFCLASIDRRAIIVAVLAQAAFVLNIFGGYNGPVWLLPLAVVTETASIAILVRAVRTLPQTNYGRAPV
jgi:Gpi18-like mannosyltransferase